MARMKEITSNSGPDIAQLLTETKRDAQECGWNNLPESPAKQAVLARLDTVAKQQFGWQDGQAELIEAEQKEHEARLAEARTLLTSLQTTRDHLHFQQRPTAPIVKWPPAMANVFVIGFGIGLGLELTGQQPGWRSYAVLGLGAALILINLPLLLALLCHLPKWVGAGMVCVAGFRALRQARQKVSVLENRCKDINEQREQLALLHRQAEAWTATNRELLMKEFDYQHARAAKAAARFAVLKTRQRMAGSEVAPKSPFERNGIPHSSPSERMIPFGF